jgi:2-deoxy-D-gluconate 3-dehydrogenase
MTSAFKLNGKKAIVTGGAGELGLAFAQALQEQGADVCVLDISEITPTVACGRPMCGIQVDLSDKAKASEAFDAAVDTLQGIDILVNAAGIQRRCPAVDFSAEDWEQVLAINLSATFYLCQKSAKLMIPKRRGKIINIASMTSFFGMKFIPAYVASKGGVMQLTKALSNEWAEHGIQVNAIAPGFIKTKMTAAYLETANAVLYESVTRRIPAGRWGEASDLKGALVFLSSEASDYITGVTLPVDGGYVGC